MLLDIGTTAHRVARQLRGRSLTVVTSNLAVYEELADDDDIQLVLLGGMVRREYRSLVGFLTEDNLRQVHADRLFLGTSGVRPGRPGDGHDGGRGAGQARDDRGQRPGRAGRRRRQVPRHRDGPGVRPGGARRRRHQRAGATRRPVAGVRARRACEVIEVVKA